MMILSSAENETGEKKFSNVLQDISQTMSIPELQIAMELLKHESSTSISNMHEQTGFYSVSNVFSASSSVIKGENINKLLNIWFKSSAFDKMPDNQKTELSLSIEEFMLGEFDNSQKISSHTKKFELQFSDGKGEIFFLFVNFKPLGNSMFQYEKYIITTEFEVALPYVIITSSYCNVNSCEQWDEIVYMPAKIKDEHTSTIINMNLGFMVDTLKML
jgi:hypothetical protein